MAIKMIGKAFKRELVEESLKNNNLTDERLSGETPFYFKIRVYDTKLQIERDETQRLILDETNDRKKDKLNNKLKTINKKIEDNEKLLFFEIKQFSWEEWEENRKSLITLNAMLKPLQETTTKINILPEDLARNYMRFLLGLITLQNPEQIVSKHLMYIINSDYALQLTDKHYNALWNDMMEINFVVTPEYKALLKLKKDKIEEDYNNNILPVWKQQYRYVKDTAKKIINWYVAKVINSIEVNSILRLVNEVIKYNDVEVKKKLIQVVEMIMNNTGLSKISMISLGKGLIYNTAGRNRSLEIR